MTQVYPLAAPGQFSPWAAVILVPLVLTMIHFIGSPYFIRLEVSPGALRIRGDLFYGRRIPLSDLALDKAAIVDNLANSEYRLGYRTNGTGLPNYKAGWFHLKNGSSALVFLRSQESAVVIPHKDGHLVVLGPARPGEFLQSLRVAAGTPAAQ